jgi:phospholipase C
VGDPGAQPTPTPETGKRLAGSLPFHSLAAGTVNEEMPFDHIVVVMMENHSFDNLLGELSRTRPEVDGLNFDAAGEAENSNPAVGGGPPNVPAHRLADTAQAKNLTQSWQATHEQINEGKMDGFVSSEHGQAESMGYYPPTVLPFAHSLANTYTLANRWFCSTPGPTYPNRRFLLAGTAFGGTTSGVKEILSALEKPPPNGTIFDRLSAQNITWADYSRDIPMTLVIPRILLEHPKHHHRFKKFLADCEAGTLPQVSFVDPKMGTLSAAGNALKQIPEEVKLLLDRLDPGETEEDPDDMYNGERWAHETVEAVVRSPAWPRTLLIYTYDEHGGYYDHVPPPQAPVPDDIPPAEPPGDYGSYGPRVPAVVVSPYSIRGGVSNTIHDHTSILATIEHKWNLPALTDRDANANTVMDMLDTSQSPRLDPPALTAPSPTGSSGPVSTGTQ